MPTEGRLAQISIYQGLEPGVDHIRIQNVNSDAYEEQLSAVRHHAVNTALHANFGECCRCDREPMPRRERPRVVCPGSPCSFA